ncbi:hypothetical protein WISP_36973 [Willisornis vidua]|uniref:Uncharacterized protein n=1 Tax=Willisornis vidua TaxID=1566151 RepID=A0ABQ9DIV8_9PASS|nr:hypothetical protein WISP_36973 [Willisornis vidua]
MTGICGVVSADPKGIVDKKCQCYICLVALNNCSRNSRDWEPNICVSPQEVPNVVFVPESGKAYLENEIQKPLVQGSRFQLQGAVEVTRSDAQEDRSSRTLCVTKFDIRSIPPLQRHLAFEAAEE